VILLATRGPLSIFLFTSSSFIAHRMWDGGGAEWGGGQLVVKDTSRHSGHKLEHWKEEFEFYGFTRSLPILECHFYCQTLSHENLWEEIINRCFCY